MTNAAMTKEEFEALKQRVESALNTDGSFRGTMEGNNYRAQIGRDVRTLIAELDRVRSTDR